MSDEDELEKAMEEDEKRSKTLPTSIEIKSEPEVAPSVYEQMDRLDCEQILAELEGLTPDVLDTMVYSFQQGGGRVTGLSWVGTKALIIEAGHYDIVDIRVIETETSYRVMAKGKDLKKNVSLWASAEQLKKMKTRNGDIDDPFALQKATSKAQRNVLQSLLPKTLVAEFIERCMKSKNEKSSPRVRYG